MKNQVFFEKEKLILPLAAIFIALVVSIMVFPVQGNCETPFFSGRLLRTLVLLPVPILNISSRLNGVHKQPGHGNQDQRPGLRICDLCAMDGGLSM
jgi:hypothetical protein